MGELFTNLGLDPLHILFYAINLILLLLVFRYLLFKPIKTSIIDKRKAMIAEVFEQNERLTREANEMKTTYDKLLMDTKQEAARVSAEAAARAQEKAEQILQDAKNQASAMLDASTRECAVERVRLANDLRQRTADMAIEIASALLMRQVNPADDEKIIAQCLSNWEQL